MLEGVIGLVRYPNKCHVIDDDLLVISTSEVLELDRSAPSLALGEEYSLLGRVQQLHSSKTAVGC